MDFGFQGVPEEVEGGVVDLSFTNDGEARHEFAVVEAPGVSEEDFRKDFGPVLEGGPFPDYATKGAAVFEAEPGDTMETSFTLEEGEYYLFCALDDEPGGEGPEQPTGKAHYELGMIQRLNVEGTNDGEVEADGGTFAARDYTFEVPETVEAGTNEFVFRNDSDEQWHHMVLQKFGTDVTEDEALKAAQTLTTLEEGQAPPEGTPQPEEAGGTGVMGPGWAETVELEFEPGTYVGMCFISDIEGGPPHAIAHQMFKAFTVEDA
jgi:hypothetical protein